jgi:hypothetical protein
MSLPTLVITGVDSLEILEQAGIRRRSARR